MEIITDYLNWYMSSDELPPPPENPAKQFNVEFPEVPNPIKRDGWIKRVVKRIRGSRGGSDKRDIDATAPASMHSTTDAVGESSLDGDPRSQGIAAEQSPEDQAPVTSDTDGRQEFADRPASNQAAEMNPSDIPASDAELDVSAKSASEKFRTDELDGGDSLQAESQMAEPAVDEQVRSEDDLRDEVGKDAK